jgi:hypothetical protein
VITQVLDHGRQAYGALPLPPAFSPVAINVTGNGTVVSVVRGLQAAGKSPLRCGTAGFLCYARYASKATLGFIAKPDPGYKFANWGGACFGQPATCVIRVGTGRSVSASFAPIDPAETASVTLDQPRVSVHWKQSVGSGQLLVAGNASKAAMIRLEFRRPTGGPLLTQQESVAAGGFKLAAQISEAALPKGAVLLPGGFVVVLTGRVGAVALPQTLRTVVLPPPSEGVVRRAFTTLTNDGKPAKSVRFGTQSAYTTFVFAAQPRRGEHLSVRWFGANGKAIGTQPESNRPTVQTGITTLKGPLPQGRYRVELWADATIIATHNVTISP